VSNLLSIESTAVLVIIKVTLLLCVVHGIATIIKPASASIKHWIWACGLFGCLLIPMLEFSLPQVKFPTQLAFSTFSPGDAETVDTQLSISEDVEVDENVAVVDSSVEGQFASEIADTKNTLVFPNDDLASQASAASTENTNFPAFESVDEPRFNWRHTVLAVWILGGLFSVLPLLVSLVRQRQILQKAKRLASDDWTQRVEVIAGQMGIHRPVRVFNLNEESMPMTWGIFRPVVVLPKSSDRWTSSRKNMVLLHEMAHIRRLDMPIQILMRFICAVYWFHPLVWMALFRLRAERERACDDYVVSHVGKATSYATELVRIAEQYRWTQLETGMAMARTNELNDRIQAMLDNRRSHSPASMRWVTAAIASALVVSTLLAGVGISGAANQDGPQDADKTRPTTDSLGDPLPQNALMRFGSVRFQHPKTVGELVLFDDETTLISFGNSAIIAWDSNSGKLKWKNPPKVGHIGGGMIYSPAAYGIQGVKAVPGSNKVYSSKSMNSLAVWEAGTGEETTLRINFGDFEKFKSDSIFKSIDISADGKLIALGNDKAMLICNASGDVQSAIGNNPKKPIKQTPLIGRSDRLRFGGEFSYGKFSPDSKTLAVVNSEKPKTVRLIDPATGKETSQFDVSERIVRMDFSPNGKTIATTERDSSARLYSVADGSRTWEVKFEEMKNAENYTSAIKFSPDGKVIAVGAPLGSQNKIRVLDSKNGNEVGTLVGHEWKPWTFTFSRDSKTLYSSGWDGNVLRWNMETFEQRPLEGVTRATGVCDYSPTDPTIAFVDSNGEILIADATDGSIRRTIESFGCSYGQIVFSSDGNLLAGAGATGEMLHLKIWEVATGKELHHWNWDKGRDPHSNVEALSFSNDGSKIAAASFRQHKAHVFDTASGKKLFDTRHPNIYGVAFSPNDEELTTVGWDASIKFWKTDNGESLQGDNINLGRPVGGGSDWRMYGVKYSPAGDRFASLHMNGPIKIWEPVKKTLLGEIEIRTGYTTGSLNFSRGGQWLAVGNRSGQIELYDAMTFEQLWSFKAHNEYVYSIRFSQDSRSLLSGGTDGLCYLWDIKPKEIVQATPGELYDDLVGGDGKAAFNAYWAMADKPQASLEIIEQKLLPARRKLDAEKVTELIEQLKSTDFKTRSTAQSTLEEFGMDAKPIVKKAIETSDSTEQRQRLNLVIRKINARANSPVLIRVLALLDHINSDASKKILRSCQQAYPDSLLGIQSKRLLK